MYVLAITMGTVDPPIFPKANNGTILKEIFTNTKAELECDVMANPTEVSFYFSNTSSDSSGVTTKVKTDVTMGGDSKKRKGRKSVLYLHIGGT